MQPTPPWKFPGRRPTFSGYVFPSLFLLALAVSLLASSSSKEGHYWRVVYLAGNGFLAVLLVGLLAAEFLLVCRRGLFCRCGNRSSATSRVRRASSCRACDKFLFEEIGLRSFRVSLLVGALTGSSTLVFLEPRCRSLWQCANAAWTFRRSLSRARSLIAGMLAVALLALLAWLVAKSVPPEGPKGVAPGLRIVEKLRRGACAEVWPYIARERRASRCVARLLEQGQSETSLFVAPGTVQSHTKRVYAKLGVHSKQELIELVNDAQTSST